MLSSMSESNPSAAPGELELVRQFVNTLDIEQGTDRLDTPSAVAGWLSANELLDTPVIQAAVGQVVQFREALRGALLANHHRTEIGAIDLAVLNETAKGLRIGFLPSGDWRAEPAQAGVDGALGELLAVVMRAMAAGRWTRLKACLNDECRWAFYDHSNARSSKWCDMRVCGNRAKQKAYRARSRR